MMLMMMMMIVIHISTRRQCADLFRYLLILPPHHHRHLSQDPTEWLEARGRFTRSCAVWSAVGHVVGLGDRHTENILLDVNIGECVHVDFDCLFDKVLANHQQPIANNRQPTTELRRQLITTCPSQLSTELESQPRNSTLNNIIIPYYHRNIITLWSTIIP